HDRFESALPQPKGGVHAAVIELNSLADTVRPAPQDHYLALAALTPLILVTVRGVIIRRVSFELCRARIDEAISGENACRFSLLTDFVFPRRHGERQLAVGERKVRGAEQLAVSCALEHRAVPCAPSGVALRCSPFSGLSRLRLGGLGCPRFSGLLQNRWAHR